MHIVDFDPSLLLFVIIWHFFLANIVSMPPKKTKAAEICKVDVEREDREVSVLSETTVGVSSVASSGTVSSDQLERILQANHSSIVALIASLPFASPRSGTPDYRSPHIKPPRWSDDEIPSEYFKKFEKAMEHNGTKVEEWGSLLRVYLSGKAQTSFSQVSDDILGNYALVKESLLRSLGDTPDSADRRWWTINRHSGEEPGAFYLRVRALGLRRVDGLKTREDVVEKTILSLFLSLLPQDCYSSVAEKRPKDGQEAAMYAQEWEETRGFDRRDRSRWTGRRQYPYYKRHDGKPQGGYNNSNNSASNNSGRVADVASSSGSNSRVLSSSQENSGKQASGGNGRTDRNSQRERKPVVCYGCGETGHIKSKCPNKVRRVSPKESVADMLVDGFLAGMAANGLRIDTGADRRVVSKDYVPESAYTGNFIQLDSWRGGQPSKHKLALINVKVGSAEAMKEVAVVDKLDCPALLGIDLGREFMISLLAPFLSHKPAEAVVPAQAMSLAPVQASILEPIRVELSPELVSNSSTQPDVAIGGSEAVVTSGNTQPKIVVGGGETIGELTSESVRGTRAQTGKEQIRIILLVLGLSANQRNWIVSLTFLILILRMNQRAPRLQHCAPGRRWRELIYPYLT